MINLGLCVLVTVLIKKFYLIRKKEEGRVRRKKSERNEKRREEDWRGGEGEGKKRGKKIEKKK